MNDARTPDPVRETATINFVPAGPPEENTESTPGTREQPLRSRPEVTTASGISPEEERTLPQIPGYRCDRLLGRGGMGVVYRAEQTALKRPVALKILYNPQTHSGRVTLERFHTETESIARLAHPNIVQIFEVGEYAGQHFFSMEYVQGLSLAQRLAATDLPSAPEAAALVQVLACAMQYAHERGVIHRDLKPANILLTERNVPKITDFGLARHVNVSSDITEAGEILGTPSYMAPEQAQGLAHKAGPQADLYALGAILYELLTGRPPFRGESSLDTIMQVRDQEVVPPRRVRSTIPKDLETMCLKCLAKDAGRRYASAQELADELQRFLDRKPIRARPIGMLSRTAKWIHRKPSLAALTAVSILLAIGGVTGITWQWQEAVERADAETAARRREQEARHDTERALAAVQQHLYFHQISLADRAWVATDIGHAEKILDNCRQEFRNWEWCYLKRLCHLELASHDHHQGPVRCVSWSPDGQRIASVASSTRSLVIWDRIRRRVVWEATKTETGPVNSCVFLADGISVATAGEDGALVLWNTSTRNKRSFHRTAPLWCVAATANGSLLAAAGKDGFSVWDARTGKERRRTVAGAELLALAFSPDGTQILTGGADGLVKLWDVATGQGVRVFQGHKGPVRSVAFHPDGKKFASTSDDQTVRLWYSEKGTEAAVIHYNTGVVRCVAYQREGTHVVSGSDNRTLQIWDTAKQVHHFAIHAHQDGVLSVACTADGRLFASGSRDGTVKVWDATASRTAKALSVNSSVPICAAFSPDGRILVHGGTDALLHLVNPVSGQTLQTFAGHQKVITSTAFSTDGKFLTSGSLDETVRIWNVQTGKATVTQRAHHGGVFAVAWSPTEALVATAGDDRLIKLWDVTTGKAVRGFQGHTGPVRSISFRSDGGEIASASDDQTVRLWEVATGKETAILRGHTATVWCATYRKHGTQVVSGSADQTVKLWDRATRTALRTFRGHARTVRSVAVSPDDTRLASGGEDTLIKLWDADTGSGLLTINDHKHSVNSVVFSPDGQSLMSASRDGTIRMR